MSTTPARVRATLRRVLLEEAEAVRAIAERLDDSFDTAVDWIVSCRGRVIPCGLGKSGHIARKAAGTLSSTGTPSLFLHAAEALHGDLGMVTGEDVLLLYSYSGESEEIVRTFPALAAIGARSIALTGRPDSTIGKLASLVLDCAVASEACPNNLAPTTSTTALLAVSDALAVAAMERRGFTREDYARFHPAGALGRRLLLTVRDVMRSGDDLALVPPVATVLEVMAAITRAGAGAACVVGPEGEMLGFVADGDLRRHLVAHRENPLEGRAAALMVREPTTISPDILAVEALEAFQNYPRKIGEMPVLDGSKVVGMLMLKDLLRSGIV
jgi:arabinose-5-phosphate isomerase